MNGMQPEIGFSSGAACTTESQDHSIQGFNTLPATGLARKALDGLQCIRLLNPAGSCPQLNALMVKSILLTTGSAV
ncbi:hypothetical protein R1flu_011241 [Riccia fluitans]|uniref:Cysteine desulfurase n=1 Tax=Riccia fluitans TaxID=41844 RepID=A0ABD1Z9S3_9MARC